MTIRCAWEHTTVAVTTVRLEAHNCNSDYYGALGITQQLLYHGTFDIFSVTLSMILTDSSRFSRSLGVRSRSLHSQCDGSVTFLHEH